MPGLYIHIPFCEKKCKYCDFVSFSDRNEYKKRYISALSEELKEYSGIKADTVFIGGGTPSCLDEEELESVLRTALLYSDRNIREFTVEANPHTLNRTKLKIMKECGVSRISIGVQSFDDSELKKIGRIHTAVQAIETVELVRSEGFSNFSLDLMSALPGQSFESFKSTLETAVLQEPAHISCYSLILEEGTPLYRECERGGLSLPDEDTEREMYEYACSYLEKNGYKRYEISNFSKPGKESLHNMKYWRCEDYIGAGLAAHSCFRGERFYNTSDLAAYLSGHFRCAKPKKLTLADKVEEFFIMGLRMSEGVSRTEFFRRFGFWPEKVYGAELAKFIGHGLLKEKGDRICLSERGISVSNSILCEFVGCGLEE